MPLLAGNVSIADDGVQTKTGYAGELFDQLLVETNAIIDEPLPIGPAGVDGLRGLALIANAVAKTIMPHLIANLDVRPRVQSAESGLQRDPDGVSGTLCLGPVLDKPFNLLSTIA